MTDRHDSWYEEDAGPLVRLFAITRGRGRAVRRELNLVTLVVDGAPGTVLRRTEPEYAAIIELCRTPQSVAEVSARLRLPLTMTKVLIGDLLDDGRLIVRSAQPPTVPESDLGLLRAVLDGIRAL
ncbi:DUF742 domain-containing protein [Nocardia beijingensis]|uniref:DUF742 domain-containing protein n=1 Tax=Nocardia beijingensis TaxID=95162 RepID=UPI001892D4C9|nr:DUF742 domain-containing protein [Nocardia beijingensis]MBF6468339.1 DUF742 domain-containing protein [Nocardia beijingensis]